MVGLFSRFFGRDDIARRWAPLYASVVRIGRARRWYADDGVADTLDGRFDMISTVLALVLLRLDAAGEAGREPAARVAELFVKDMDGQLRQQGIGDIVVGKHIGRMMAALGGRTAAYREALGPGGDLGAALARNVHRQADAAAGAATSLEAGVRALFDRIMATPLDAVLAGDLPGEGE